MRNQHDVIVLIPAVHWDTEADAIRKDALSTVHKVQTCAQLDGAAANEPEMSDYAYQG